MKKYMRVITVFAAAALLLVLSGCFTKSADRLYVLPRLSEEYLQLQGELDKVRASGAEYSAPAAGSFRQTVQLEDLDGDGFKEAIAFFKMEDDPKPLKVYIYNDIEGRYSKKAVIEGEGMNIESVAYVDLSGDGKKEMLVGWQMSPGVKRLSVYMIQNYDVSLSVSTDCTKYSLFDATGDKCTDLVVLRLSSSELSGEALLYTADENGELGLSSARLSTGVESVSLVRTGSLSGGRKALFVESVINGSSVVTDILAYKFGALENITADKGTGISESTLRTYTGVNCRDIDEDGIMDVPNPVMLPTRSSTAVYWAIEWYSYDIRGEKELRLTTFYNVADGWFFVLPPEWNGRITVRREDTVPGERAIVFSELGAGVAAIDILEIYSLTGHGRETRAEKGNRFILASNDSTIFAANLYRAGVTLRVSEKYVKENFSLIYSEWTTE